MTPVALSEDKKNMYPPERWGVIRNPRNIRKNIPDPYFWCLDNDAFNEFDEDLFLKAIQNFKDHQDRCLFVVSPDVIGNALETMQLYEQWYPVIKAEGWKVAFVAQDGQQYLSLPKDYDALFIGGTTKFKLSRHVKRLIREAKQNNKWVHVGRVNSQKRIKNFLLDGVDSVDGTNPIFAPNKNVPKLDGALRQRPLFRNGE